MKRRSLNLPLNLPDERLDKVADRLTALQEQVELLKADFAPLLKEEFVPGSPLHVEPTRKKKRRTRKKPIVY